jgi:hypothetical protein
MRRLIVIASLVVSCHPVVAPDSPADAYRAFAAAENKGDDTVAWNLLSRATQAELTKQAQAIAKVRGVPAPADGKQLAFRDANVLHGEIKSIATSESGANAATLTVTDDRGGTQDVRMVREDEHWAVDLAAEVQKANGN